MRVAIYTELQQLDQRLSALAQARDGLLAQLAERDQLQAWQQQLDELTRVLKGERAHSTDLQWELDEVELRLAALDEQERDGPSDPLVAREMAVLRERRAQLEEQVLTQLERIGELERQLADVERKVSDATAAWAAREPQLQAELERISRELEALQAQRQQVAARLSPDALALYDDLQRRHRGTALAPIRHRQCGICRARLPAAVFDLLAAPDPLVRCPRCGRVLYLPSEPSEAGSA